MLKLLLLSISALLATACTKAMYDGPARPRSELALLSARDSVITAIDSKRTRAATSFEVLPGQHLVEVSLFLKADGGIYLARTTRKVCMRAEAGRQYLVHAEMRRDAWRAYVVDEETGFLASYKHPSCPAHQRPADAAEPEDPPWSLDEL